MGRIFKGRESRQRIPSDIDPEVSSQLAAMDNVLGFRDKLASDTEFRGALRASILEAKARSDVSDSQEARDRATAYAGNMVLGQELGPKGRAAKADIFNSVIRLLDWAAISGEFDGDVFVAELRREIGENVNDASEEALLTTSPLLTAGNTLSVVDSDLGFISVIERLPDPNQTVGELQAQSRQARASASAFDDDVRRIQ